MIQDRHLANRARGLLSLLASALVFTGVSGCGPKEIKPVDIYPEDMCAFCRMAISDQRFAAEIISDEGEAFKFDDIGCLEEFFKMKPVTLKVATVFYKDYPTKAWLPVAQATVVETGVTTPMGSGKVAFADSSRARIFREEHPPDRKGEPAR
jgi:copper chaperone NosL